MSKIETVRENNIRLTMDISYAKLSFFPYILCRMDLDFHLMVSVPCTSFNGYGFVYIVNIVSLTISLALSFDLSYF